MSQKLIDEHRYINVEHEQWWEHIYEGWVEKLKEKGIEMGQLYFSGFSSQGDGACFWGNLANEALFLQLHATTDEYPMLRQAKPPFAYCSWKHRGHYYHANTLRFDYDGVEFGVAMDAVYDMAVLDDMGITLFDEQYDREQQEFEHMVETAVKDYCNEIYRELEQEYDYLTSDECVEETLRANDMWEEENDHE